VFDGTSAVDALADSGWAGTVDGIQLNAGYAGVLTFGRNVVVRSGGTTVFAGTLQLGSGSHDFSGTTLIDGGIFDLETSTATFKGVSPPQKLHRANGSIRLQVAHSYIAA
jgi:autotransporter-associated beta strand protein